MENKKVLKLTDFQKNEEEFRAITSNMQEGFIIIDTKTLVLSFNNGIEKLFDVHDIKIGDSVFTINRSEVFREVVEGSLEVEKEKLGAYISAHPLDRYADVYKTTAITHISDNQKDWQKLSGRLPILCIWLCLICIGCILSIFAYRKLSYHS